LHKHRFLLLVFLGLLSSTSLAQSPSPSPQCPPAIDRSRDQASPANVWASETEPRDGLVSVNHCGFYKRGKTIARRLPKEKLREVPSELMTLQMYGAPRNEKIRIDELPVGYSLYNDAVFEVVTEAIPDWSYVVLRLPSVKSEEEFKKLRVLHLTEDIVVPGLLRWEQMSNGAGNYFDFATRTLRAEFDLMSAFRHASPIGRIAVASFNSEAYEAAAVDLWIGSVAGPPSVRGGDEFTYKISVVNGGLRPVIAHGVVFTFDLQSARLQSISTPQGRYGRSMQSTESFICEIDSIAPKGIAEIAVTARAQNFIRSKELPQLTVASLSRVTSREKDYSPENNRHVSLSTVIVPTSRTVKRKLH
jgi:hypothetical protein